MSVGDITGVVCGMLSVLLLWQQNQIFKGQNAIFAMQSGASGMSPEPAERLRRYWPMLAMAAMTALTWSAVAYDVYVRHHGSPATELKPIILGLGFNGLREGSPTQVNAGLRDQGPLPALRVAWAGKVFWSRDLSKTEEDDAWSDFARIAGEMQAGDLHVDNTSWETFKTDPLSKLQLADINNGVLRLYVFIRYEYSDVAGDHSGTFCVDCQTPIVEGAEAVWHTCRDQDHNTIR